MAKASSSSSAPNPSESDSQYVAEARIVRDHIQQLNSIASHLHNHQSTSEVHKSLKQARLLAVETNDRIKRFQVIASSSVYGTERAQRKMMHKQFRTQYQAALKFIDAAAQEIIRANSETHKLSPAHGDSDYSTHSLENFSSKKTKSRDPKLKPARHPQYLELADDTTSASSHQPVVIYPTKQARQLTNNHVYNAEYVQGVGQVEKDVQGIKELYKEMAWQLNTSVDDLDAIETQMRSAVDHSDMAVHELTSTSRMIRRQHRLLIVAFILVIMVALVIYIIHKL